MVIQMAADQHMELCLETRKIKILLSELLSLTAEYHTCFECQMIERCKGVTVKLKMTMFPFAGFYYQPTIITLNKKKNYENIVQLDYQLVK
jgi:hypothetical protein